MAIPPRENNIQAPLNYDYTKPPLPPMQQNQLYDYMQPPVQPHRIQNNFPQAPTLQPSPHFQATSLQPQTNSTTATTNAQFQNVISPHASNSKATNAQTSALPTAMSYPLATSASTTIFYDTNDEATKLMVKRHLEKDAKGDSLLLKACEEGKQTHIVMIAMDVMQKEKISRSTHMDTSQQTCLHRACKSGNLDIVLAVLKKTYRSFMASHARYWSDNNALDDIIEGIQKINRATHDDPKFIDQPDVNGVTAQEIAVTNGQIFIMLALISAGSKQHDKEGKKLLKIAIEKGHHLIGFYLVLKGVEPDKITCEKKDEFNEFLRICKIEDREIKKFTYDSIKLRRRINERRDFRALLIALTLVRLEAYEQLSYACLVGCSEVVKIFTRHYDLSAENVVGTNSVLTSISKQNNAAIVDVLNTTGYASFIANSAKTIFCNAACNFAPEVVAKMIQIIKSQGTMSINNIKSASNTSPMDLACQLEILNPDRTVLNQTFIDEKTKLIRSLATIQLLSSEGFKPTQTMLIYLMKTLKYDGPEAQALVTYLIQIGTPVNVHESKNPEANPLSQAKKNGLKNVFKLLSEASAREFKAKASKT